MVSLRRVVALGALSVGYVEGSACKPKTDVQSTLLSSSTSLSRLTSIASTSISSLSGFQPASSSTAIPDAFSQSVSAPSAASDFNSAISGLNGTSLSSEVTSASDGSMLSTTVTNTDEANTAATSLPSSVTIGSTSASTTYFSSTTENTATSHPASEPLNGVCNDSCAHDVAAAGLGSVSVARHLVNCNALLRSTTTVDAATVTSTRTVFSTLNEGDRITTIDLNQDLFKRRLVPVNQSPLPTYASACDGMAAYSSACECMGASDSISTVSGVTVTISITTTSLVTIEGNSPPYIPTASIELPTDRSWTRTYSYYDVTLFAYPPYPEAIDLPTPSNDPECVVDPSNEGGEFILADVHRGVLTNRNGKPAPPAAPTSEAEARAMGDFSNWVAPLYKFEKSEGAAEGMYDLVYLDGGDKPYIAMNADKELIFTSSSTKGAIQSGMITTIFRVSCTGAVSIEFDGVKYSWRGLDDSTVITTGSTLSSIVALPKERFPGLDTEAASATIAKTRVRRDLDWGLAPRCPGGGADITSRRKDGARGPNPNGCGSADFDVPNFNFGSCCDNHDNCYDDCSRTFEGCNWDFGVCMQEACLDVLDSIWTFWLYPGCVIAGAVYEIAVMGFAQKAFYQANSEVCECVCTESRPEGLKRSYCYQSCIITGGSDNYNCGGCDYQCGYKTHCNFGTCVCDDARCGNKCVNFLTHPKNCGSCGNVCPGNFCYQGVCWDPPPIPDRCYPVEAVKSRTFAYNSAHEGVASAGPNKISYPVDNYYRSGYLTLSVNLCPGEHYDLEFKINRGPGECWMSVSVGPTRVYYQETLPAGLSEWGPNPVTVNPGDSNTFKVNDDWYLNAGLSFEFACNGGTIELTEATIHQS